MPSRRKIAPTVSLLALTLALLLASALAWACGPAAPAVQEGGLEATPTPGVTDEPTATATPAPTPTPTPTPESDVTDDLEYVALAVYRLAERQNQGAAGASGSSSGPQLPERIYVHITAWTEAVDDLERMLRDNGATDISVIKDGKVSIVESQAPPGLLPEITRHLAFLHAFTSGIYPNMEQSLNDALTMYAGGIFTEAETARHIMDDLYFPEYPENIIVKVELEAPESYASVRDFLTSEGAFPHDIKPGASWFYAGVPVSIVDDLYSYQGVIYIDHYPRYRLNIIEPTSAIPSPEAPTPTPGATPRLELVAQAVFQLAEQEQNRGASGAGGASSGPRLPDKIFAHITALTENVGDLNRLLRDNDASDISVINDGVISTVEAQIPPTLLPAITRHPAFLEAFTDGIYPNMDQALSNYLTRYAAGILTAAQASERIMGETFPKYPENIVVKVELTSAEVNDTVRNFLISKGAFPHPKEPGEAWFYAGVPVSVVGELSAYPGVSYIDRYPRSWP